MSDPAVSATARHPRLIWGLLVSWLIYSGAVLGYALANDPLLSTYVCMTR